jgi:hypothetical protein
MDKRITAIETVVGGQTGELIIRACSIYTITVMRNAGIVTERRPVEAWCYSFS